MTRVREIMLALNVDRMTAKFYEALEKGETTGDLVIVDDDKAPENPPGKPDA